MGGPEESLVGSRRMALCPCLSRRPGGMLPVFANVKADIWTAVSLAAPGVVRVLRVCEDNPDGGIILVEADTYPA